MPDIDIDFADRDIILDKINHRVARLNKDKKHNTGVYVTEIPHNPVDNMSTLDYEEADDRGYFKLDFLNVLGPNGYADICSIGCVLAPNKLCCPPGILHLIPCGCSGVSGTRTTL